MYKSPEISVVIIGRNEGEKLIRCFESVHRANWGKIDYDLIYVDSRSDDESIANALDHDAKSIELIDGRLCAARARNHGIAASCGKYILFLDGDTVLDKDFPAAALNSLKADSSVCAVWGHRRELHPENSIYNRVLDLDWVYPAGQTEYCGGDTLFKREALEAVKGFNEHLIAGEEPEMCRRLRALGWNILHLDIAMTGHDLDIRHFKQYWKRAERAGYAYAQVSDLYADSCDPLWQKQMKKNYVQSALMLLGLLVAVLSFSQTWWLGLAMCSAAAVLLTRTAVRSLWKTKSPAMAALYAVHTYIQKLPIAVGQLSFILAKRKGQYRSLIEYKA